MDISNSLNRIAQILQDKKTNLRVKISLIERLLPKKEDYVFLPSKARLLQLAQQSGANRFRLLATLNDNLMIFAWCDRQSNFIGIASMPIYENEAIDYRLAELDTVIDNAEQYLKSVKSNDCFSGSPFLISNLQIMAI